MTRSKFVHFGFPTATCRLRELARPSLSLGLLLGLPRICDAHLVTTGLGPVYDGIGHLLLTPQDLIAVLALCLFAGLRGAEHSRKLLFVLPIVWFAAGNFVGSSFGGFGAFPFSAISFIVLGLLVATDVKISPLGLAVLAILLGAVHGYDNGIALEQNAGAMGLLGIMAALFVVIAIATATVVSLKKTWMRIVIRVLGSWVVATGILMLGWHYRLETSVAAASINALAGKTPGKTADASYTNTIGDAVLTAYWEDPNFDSTQPAFYYVRVIEIPTPRWTAYDAKRFKKKMSDEVPMTTQERAYTSPIWYPHSRSPTGPRHSRSLPKGLCAASQSLTGNVSEGHYTADQLLTRSINEGLFAANHFLTRNMSEGGALVRKTPSLTLRVTKNRNP